MRTLIRLSVCALMLGSMGTLHLSPVQSALAAPADDKKNLSVKSQKEFEKTLTKAIEEEQEELNVTWQGAKKKEISAILKAVKKNNLDIYNIYMDRRGVQISLSIQYHYDKSLIEESSTAQSNKDTLKTISKLIADFKKPGTSDFEKVAGIHDLLVQKFQYAGNNDDVVSVLQQKHGTKEGLTRTAYVLLKKLDVDVMRVRAKSDRENMWNLVRIDDKWYHMDIAADADKLYRKRMPKNIIPADFFLLTDEEMTAAGYTWETMDYPPTDALTKVDFKKKELSFHKTQDFIEAMEREHNRGQDSFQAKLQGAEHKIETYLKQEGRKNASLCPIRAYRISNNDVITVFFK